MLGAPSMKRRGPAGGGAVRRTRIFSGLNVPRVPRRYVWIALAGESKGLCSCCQVGEVAGEGVEEGRRERGRDGKKVREEGGREAQKKEDGKIFSWVSNQDPSVACLTSRPLAELLYRSSSWRLIELERTTSSLSVLVLVQPTLFLLSLNLTDLLFSLYTSHSLQLPFFSSSTSSPPLPPPRSLRTTVHPSTPSVNV